MEINALKQSSDNVISLSSMPLYQQRREAVITSNRTNNNIDTFEYSNGLEKKKSEEKSSINWKKWLFIGGCAMAGVLLARYAGKKLIGNYLEKNRWRFIGSSLPELKEATKLEQFSRIKVLDGLSNKQKRNFLNDIKGFDESEFFATLTGHKPACLLYSRDITALTSSSSFNEAFDLVALPSHGDKKYFLNYILNRKKVMEIIEQNKDLYIHRMGLDANTGLEAIYSELVKNGDKYLQTSMTAKTTDLVGITLGFPRKSSMVFQLENSSNDCLRNKLKEYRRFLLEKLFAVDSPYRDLPQDAIDDLEKSIKSIAPTKRGSGLKIYQFAKLVNEPEEMKRIKEAEKAFRKQFSFQSLV